MQGASASHHAADKLKAGYDTAGQLVTDAVNQVNPDILRTAAEAGQTVTDAAGVAGGRATTAAEYLKSLLDPYISTGSTAAAGLTDAAKPFTADMMAQYSPAYQFQLQQGKEAAARAAAAAGLGQSGGTMKSLMRYVQDYAGTGFERASNLYNQNFNRLATLADMGQKAATTAGQSGLQAAEYAGDLGMRGAEFAGTSNINARNLASSNTLSGANYLANARIGAQNALAQGDLGAAASWNQMLGGIGSAANTAVMAGFGGDGNWGWSNIGKNISKVWGK